MKIYHYAPTNGAYLGEGEADESPLEPGVFLVPAFATDSPPPDFVPGESIAVRTGNEWVVQPDHRGQSGWVDGEELEITDPGPYPEGWSTEPPPPPSTPQPEREISKRQLLLALWRMQQITDAQIRAAIANDDEALIEWDATATVRRANPAVDAAGQRLGFDAAALDALFDYAATL